MMILALFIVGMIKNDYETKKEQKISTNNKLNSAQKESIAGLRLNSIINNQQQTNDRITKLEPK